MKRIGVLTSGGDAPGMNAALRAVVRVAIYKGLKVSGIRRGYQGLIEGDIFEMDVSSVGDIIQRGGTILQSARCLEFKKDEGIKRGVEVLKMFNIDGLVVIGGDGSFMGAKRLSDAGIPTIGIPGTIDNDLAYTDYTVGFDTAINTVVNAVGNIRDTSSSHQRASIIEVMGRSCGDIALYSGIAGGAETIIVPEIDFTYDDICKKLIQGQNRGKVHSIILLAEGVGKPYEFAEAIKNKTGIDVRVSVIGYLQRGGSPTAFDRILASKFGSKAVELLIEGKKSRALGTNGNKVFDMDITEAITMKKEMDHCMYDLADMLSI
ncbi:6-phosphofructokinase [Helicovermis profundi]|uniref:ATP-dependent 6-phosphofructokinase n=1 Tax=Helicovermis profundi TaxID=3065157 RepID=A0AAU9ENP1_9FIRM|nr:6-phosphofructokinase [Clostridia bacterium S502]